MKTFFTILFLCLAPSVYPSSAIPVDEIPVIIAAVQFEIDSSDVSSRRPILLLDETDNWMPPEEKEEDLSKFPDYVQEDITRQIEEKRVPKELRSVNGSRYSLKSISLPMPVLLHRSSDFRDDYSKTSSFQKLVKKLRKEPFVIRVSRPYKTEIGKAVILIHGISTWSECGGLSLVKLYHSGSGWKVAEKTLLIIW